MSKAARGCWGTVSVVLYGGLALLFTLGGLAITYTGLRELQLGKTPVTPLAELAKHAGTEEKVRVEGKPSGTPLTNGAGQSLALQRIEVGHSSGSANRSSYTVDHIEVVPPRLVLKDGDTEVEVMTAGVDRRFMQEAARGSAGKGAVLPSNVTDHLAVDVAKLPLREGRSVTVHQVPAGETLTVYGIVRLENGKPVLQAEEADKLFVISARPFDKIVAEARSESGAGVLWGIVFSILGPLWGWYQLRGFRRGKRS